MLWAIDHWGGEPHLILASAAASQLNPRFARVSLRRNEAGRYGLAFHS